MSNRPETIRGFASDNCSGAHPRVLEAIAAANEGHATSYGADPVTVALDVLVRSEFGEQVRFFPMMNGTGANVAALRATARPHQAVICAETAHLTIDETAAPEAIAGLKLLGVPTPDGKLTPETAATRLVDRADLPHIAWPAVITISQPTELGTVYRPEEIRALAEFAGEHDLVLHMDGARIFNAAAFLGCGLAAASTDHGVDVLSLGANKNGIVFGEAVLFTDPAMAEGFGVLRKGTLQLASKMRFLSAQIAALLEADLGLELAAAANARASLLAGRIEAMEGAVLAQPVEANIVFVAMPLGQARDFADRLSPFRPLLFEVGEAGLIRLVCSWDTTEEDVEVAAAALGEALAG